MSSAQLIDHSDEYGAHTSRFQFDSRWSELDRAIVLAVAYADVFDYPLTSAEIQRYLAGVEASEQAVQQALEDEKLVPQALTRLGPYVLLSGREAIVATRQRREAIAARFWPAAVAYGQMIARLPFVRMVAVTGALAVSNVEADADIDYLVITEPGRLWLSRAAIIVLVRLAARRGARLCPNYLLSERALVIQERSLYSAHELVQMVPIAGLPIYQRMRQANQWANTLLPNATAVPRVVNPQPARGQRLQATTELILRSRAGGWLERWEMERKVRKFSAQHADNPEISLNADCCKGHVSRHRQRTLAAYADRVRSVDSATH